MERRIYFVLGDLTANICAGIAASLLATALVETSWPLPIAFVFGWVLGSIIGLIVSFAFMPLFGAFEVMLPTTLSGMTAGTCVATLLAWHELEPKVAGGVGALLGIAVFVGTYLLNARLHTKG